jgi:hypothetical protein
LLNVSKIQIANKHGVEIKKNISRSRSLMTPETTSIVFDKLAEKPMFVKCVFMTNFIAFLSASVNGKAN